MLQPELKFRRDKIRYLMAQQGPDSLKCKFALYVW